ncbi:MAG: tRNA-dihydrouridine synthase family protein [Coprobacillus sp.]|nr:tRNA-dihydrouridine synthase family protein [Coprobacillus sp.]
MEKLDIEKRKEVSRVVLGPMAGYTFYSYRKFMEKYKVAFSYTEMVSDMGIIYDNEETLSYLKTDDKEWPLGLQLFGSDPIHLAQAAKKALELEPRFAFIDINCGCPVSKVMKSGAGSSLLSDPENIKKIVQEIKKTCNIPVSIKIRMGLDMEHLNYKEVINAAVIGGVDFIAIHARTRSMLYSGKPLYDELKDIKKWCPVPIVISGDIFTLDDVIKIDNLIHPDFFMIARGGLGNPYLIKQINTYFKSGKKLPPLSTKKQLKLCLKLGKMICKDKGEEAGTRIYRSIAPHFIEGVPHSKKIRSALSSNLNTYADLKQIIKDYRKSL